MSGLAIEQKEQKRKRIGVEEWNSGNSGKEKRSSDRTEKVEKQQSG